MVELPLALPVMMAGIRTAAVWVIGTATLSTPIGQTSLGNYIFAGLQTQNWVFVLFRYLCAAVLALAVDQLLALVEPASTTASRLRAAIGGARHCGAGGVDAGSLAVATVLACRGRRQDLCRAICAGGADAQRLQAAGQARDDRQGLGWANVTLRCADRTGDIDVYIDYSGTLWANVAFTTATSARAIGAPCSQIGRPSLAKH